jgi:hypothetical protein
MASKDDNLRLYSEYNKTLRAWLVGFGFGVPALFIVNAAAQERLLAASNSKFIVWLFLLGAAAQIGMAFINKEISWCAFHKNDVGSSNVNRFVSWAAGYENTFGIDVALDIISLIAFSWSIILIMGLY